MTLREDPQQGVFVEGLEALQVHSLDQALDVINAALENRVMASTLMVFLHSLSLLLSSSFFAFILLHYLLVKPFHHHHLMISPECNVE